METEKIGKYALYAITDFTTLFVKDMKRNNGYGPEIICDKNAGNLCYMEEELGCVITFPKEMFHMYKNGGIQKIIVMSVLHENEIIDELLLGGVLLQDIISIVSVLYS